MTVAYATEAELAAWLDAAAPVGADRLLMRASELVDGQAGLVAFDVSSVSNLPTDVAFAAALRDAVCAQVEFWIEVGEEHDILGLPAHTFINAGFTINRQPPLLAPRSRRALANAGLLSSEVMSS